MEEQNKKNIVEHQKIQANLEASREELENFYQTDMIGVNDLVEAAASATQGMGTYQQQPKEEKGYARVRKMFKGK